MTPSTSFINPYLFDFQKLQKNWGWLLALGISSIIPGILALGSSVFFTVAPMILFGCIVLIMGVLEIAHLFWQRHWTGLFLHLLNGILPLVVGVIMISSPAASALILTQLLAVFFMLAGLFQVIIALSMRSMRFPSWGWRLFNGIISLLLGVLIWAQWPLSGLWVIGLFIGIDLIFSGWSSVMLALAAHHLQPRTEGLPRVVIVGGGFGGLAAAKALRHTPAHVTLIDRTNHHLFQPLLYQVAISVLAPGNIAFPIRGILRNQENATVILGEVTGVDKDRQCIFANSADREGVPLPYDYLILATGVSHSYFGHDEFAKFAPGLKSLADAVATRNKILQAFEIGEAEEDPNRHRDLLTFVLVGGGPTGVEMAGAIAVLVRNTLRSEFRRIDPTSARIVLVDRGNRVLKSFSEEISEAVTARLGKLGVEVRLGHGVDQIDEDGVLIAGERIPSKTVIWTAGVAPSPAGKWLNVETDHAGRVRVRKDLTVPGHPQILVVGDTASLDQDGSPLPGVAQVAIQQGRYAGKLIHSRITGTASPEPFRYFDKGSMAVVGKGFGVLQIGKFHLSGFFTWLVWALVHLQSLAQSSLKLSVFVQWIWTYVTGQRGSRLIEDQCGAEPVRPKPSHPATEG